MTYNPGQVSRIFPYMPEEAEWFLLAGPADGNEAQVIRGLYPRLRIAGFEPNPTMFEVQRQREDFPDLLLPVALWSGPKDLTLRTGPADESLGHLQPDRCSSLVRFENATAKEYQVKADSLDRLSQHFGPFNNAVLWADIEGSELECLRGSEGLLNKGQLLLLNLEVSTEIEEDVRKLLQRHGIVEVERWNYNNQDGREWSDIIYKKASLIPA